MLLLFIALLIALIGIVLSTVGYSDTGSIIILICLGLNIGIACVDLYLLIFQTK